LVGGIGVPGAENDPDAERLIPLLLALPMLRRTPSDPLDVAAKDGMAYGRSL